MTSLTQTHQLDRPKPYALLLYKPPIRYSFPHPQPKEISLVSILKRNIRNGFFQLLLPDLFPGFVICKHGRWPSRPSSSAIASNANFAKNWTATIVINSKSATANNTNIANYSTISAKACRATSAS